MCRLRICSSASALFVNQRKGQTRISSLTERYASLSVLLGIFWIEEKSNMHFRSHLHQHKLHLKLKKKKKKSMMYVFFRKDM